MTSIKITRRQFLKWLSASAAALGLSQTDLLKIKEALAAGPTPDPNFPVAPPGRGIWIAGVVLEIITIDYSQIVMATSGDVPNNYLLSMLADPNYKYVLLVEGSIQTASNGKFCRIMDVTRQIAGVGNPWS